MPPLDRSNNGLATVANEKCQLCYDHDPHIRSSHHMAIAAEHGMDYFKAHIEDSYLHKHSEYGNDGSDTVHGLVAWIGNLKGIYSGMVYEEDGSPMSWWIARKRMHRQREESAQKAYEDAPQEYQDRVKEEDKHKPVRTWIHDIAEKYGMESAYGEPLKDEAFERRKAELLEQARKIQAETTKEN